MISLIGDILRLSEMDPRSFPMTKRDYNHNRNLFKKGTSQTASNSSNEWHRYGGKSQPWL